MAKPLPPLPTEEELARRAAAAAAGPVVPIEFKATGPAVAALQAPRAVVAEVDLAHTSWLTTSNGPTTVEHLDLSVHGATLARGLTADVDLRAEHWTSRSVERFRPNESNRVYVWQAQLDWEPSSRLGLLAGRVLPWAIPGATVMDGAVLQLRGDGLSGGVFGGLVPNYDTLYPTVDRYTGGAFWSVDKRFANGLVLRQEGRLAVVHMPELGTRGELEATAAAYAGAAFDLLATIRLGAGGLIQADGMVDGGRVEASWRPAKRLATTVAFEYGGLAVPQAAAPSAFATTTRRGDASVFWDQTSWRFGLTGGASRDLANGTQRAWVGPELQLPTLLASRLALSTGYQEEVGWLSGRSAFVQALYRPWDPLRIVARASWLHESNLAITQDEAGLYLAVAAELSRHLGLRLSVLGRGGFDISGDGGGAQPGGLVAMATLYGLF